MSFLTDDIDAMLDDALGVDVLIGDVEGRGILDESASVGLTEGGLEAQARATTLLVRTGKFPDLTKFCPVEADGRRFKADDFMLQDDGKTTLILLSRRTS